MENEFIAHGSYCVSNAGGYLIELSNCGSMARVKDDYGSNNPQVSDWLEIEIVDDNSSELDEEGNPGWCAVIDPAGYNINMYAIMRI